MGIHALTPRTHSQSGVNLYRPTFTTFVPSDADTKKNGKLRLSGNAKALSVTL
jgi:hypothetical protein